MIAPIDPSEVPSTPAPPTKIEEYRCKRCGRLLRGAREIIRKLCAGCQSDDRD